MRKVLMICGIAALAVCLLEGKSSAEEASIETEVRQQVLQDLEQIRDMPLQERTCLDGRPVKGFEGDIAEYWVDLECPYCGVVEPARAQRAMPNLCIVVRHAASPGESVKKALSYEALKHFSSNAANRFWDAVHPRESAIPAPHQEALMTALREAAINPETFADVLQKEATARVNEDMAAASRIRSTPTYVLNGIRFNSCDFTAEQLEKAVALAKKAHSGDAEAIKKVISVITKGRMSEDFAL